MKDIQQRLLATFQVEHRDHVEQIRSILALIHEIGLESAGSELEEVFRRAHSLKGAARAVDLHSVEQLAHRLESLFSRMRKGKCALNADVTSVVHQVLDASEDCLSALVENRAAESVPAALRVIDQMLGNETAPPADRPREEQAQAPAFQPLETVRIVTQDFDGLFRTAAVLVAETRREDHVTEELNKLAREMAFFQRDGERLRRLAISVAMRAPAGPEQSRLISSLDEMQRQLRSLSRQVRLSCRLQHKSAWNMHQLGRQLQADVWQARMVPAESLLEGFRKMVRDLARDEGKEIDFRASCAGVRADRRVLEALKNPIMHLLRNAVGHGIESTSERIANEKNRAGTVSLEVDANGQQLTVAIQDDGRGLNFARITEVAIREGILSPAEAKHQSHQDLIRILFRPGFSTSSSVTSLSGRGMGMSVVYEAIRRLQGDLEVQSVPAGGTLITLSVPLSMSTHRLVVVKRQDDLFAIPILAIDRLTRIRLADIQTIEGKPVIVLDGQSLPLVSIHALLGVENSTTGAGSITLQVVVLRSGGRKIALAVDTVMSEVDTVIQDLGPATSCAGKISTGVVLDGGAIAFVIDPMELIEAGTRSQSQWRPPTPSHASEPVGDPAPPSILIVDDSMTTRALEKSIFEAYGYHVRVAVDGIDALTRLRQQTADLVISDIEMPRLNGFGLLEAMKQDKNLKDIPVIIISSVERREDQERGLALGADAYIVKHRFDQEELLATVRQIL